MHDELQWADIYRRFRLVLPNGEEHPVDLLEARVREWSHLLVRRLDKLVGHWMLQRMAEFDSRTKPTSK